MCYGSVDTTTLMRETEDRLRHAAPAPAKATADSVPEPQIGGLVAVWRTVVERVRRKPAQLSAE